MAGACLVDGSCAEPLSLHDLVETFEQPAGAPPTPRHTGVHALVKNLFDDVKHLPSKENAYWAAFGGGLALAVHPADDDLNEFFVGNDLAEKIFKPGAIIGQLYTLLVEQDLDLNPQLKDRLADARARAERFLH